MPLERTIRIHTTPVTRLRPHHANGEHASGRCIGPNATQVELTSVKEIVGAKTRAAPAVTGITVSNWILGSPRATCWPVPFTSETQ